MKYRTWAEPYSECGPGRGDPGPAGAKCTLGICKSFAHCSGHHHHHGKGWLDHDLAQGDRGLGICESFTHHGGHHHHHGGHHYYRDGNFQNHGEGCQKCPESAESGENREGKSQE